jgi:hypothetical protein
VDDHQQDGGIHVSTNGEDKTAPRRLKLSGGQWVEMTTELSGNDYLALMSLSPDDEQMAASVAEIVRFVKRHTVRHSFGGDIGDQTIPVLTDIFVAWQNGEEEAALPPAKGGRSPRRSPASL